ncbi:FG-GAP-like repeat-containing protein [SAR92 clade bacterium H231]|nr:FG-GAP-like repeat-containing protein [SAR92 clade bacterium H231]
MPGIAQFKKIFVVVFIALVTSTLTAGAVAGDIDVNLSSPATNTSGSYTVTWTGGTFLYLEEKKDSGSWTTVYSGAGSSKSFSGKGVGTYQYRIRLYFCFVPVIFCLNLYTDPVTTVVSVALPSAPGAITGPSNVTYPSGSSASYSLSWGAASGTVTSYELQEQVNSGSWTTVQNTSSLSKSFSGKLAATYYYRVRACNASGCSGYGGTKSVMVSIATSLPQTPPAPYNPDPGALVTGSEVTATDNAGVSGGSFRVDESGSATYSMPIMTLAGTAGVVPEVSLNYSSNSGNGIAGLGWNIGGLSAISRCRQTLHQDQQAKSITFSATDRFCLDGQRLILTSGTYGASGSIYKTEIDSFAKIEAFGGSTGHPDYWKVYRKDGSTSTYGWSGTNNDSELEAWSGSTKSGKVASWAIKQLLDSANNQIVYTYSNDVDGFRVADLRYAYAGSTNITGSGNARIRFEYENRNDQSHNYIAGYSIYTKKRLIRALSENKVGGTWKEVRRYKLNYHAELSTDKLSRLDNIEECIGSTCLPNDTSFTWSLPVAGESYSTSDTSFTMNNLVTYQLADFNGDGQSDIVWAKHKSSGSDQGLQVAYGNGASLTTQTLVNHAGVAQTSIHYNDDPTNDQVLKLFPFDYNADGRSDLAVYSYRNEFGHTVGWHLYLSEYDSAINDWKLKFQHDLVIKDEHAVFADLNSDGLVDAISDNKVYYLEHDTSQGVTSNKYYEFDYQHDVDVGSLPADSTGPQIITHEFEGFRTAGADFNGDGQADGLALIKRTVVTFVPTISSITLYGVSLRVNQGVANGKQTFAEINGPLNDDTYFIFSSQKDDYLRQIQTPDINGDGLSDLVYYKNNEFHYALSDGTQLNYGGALVNAGAINDAKKADFSMADINRDGFPDAIWHDFSTSYGYIRARKWNPASQSFDGQSSIRNGVGDDKDDSHVYFDFNADTITDYVTFENNKFEVYEGNGANQPVNRITSITNGLGAVTNISYGTLGQSDHYTHLDANYTDTTQGTCTLDLSNFILGGGGVIEYDCPVTSVDLNGFYSALNGEWDLPSGTHTLGKQDNPVLELNGPMFVVTDVESSAPAAHNSSPSQVDNTATSSISYHYGEAKIQAMGRGMLGFKTLTTIDNQTAVTTRTTYRQDFPFIGQPLNTKVYSGEGHLLGESTNETRLIGWNGSGTPANSYYAPYNYQSIDKSYSLVNNGATAGSLLQTATTTSSYDSDGNATSITVKTSGGGKNFEKVVTNTYTAAGFSAAESKRLGRLSHTQVTTKRDENGDGGYELSDTRNSSFSYITSGNLKGLLQTETIEPGTSFEHSITHSYDSFGNKVKAETTAYAGNGTNPQTRFSESVYDSQGRYVEETKEQFSNSSGNPVTKTVSEVISRNDYGAATETRTWVDDNNYVTSKASYTPFGIKYFESNSTGAYSINTLASGAGSQCPTGTVFYSRSRTAGGGESQQCFDNLGRSIRKAAQGFSGTWSYSDTEYDSVGRVLHQSEPYFAGQTSCNSSSNTSKCWATISYDILGRPTSATAPDGSVSTTAYSGLSTITTNALNQDKTETKNVLGEMVSVTDNLNGTTTYGYDAQGNLKTMSDAANNTTTLVYDKLGRKTSMSDPDKGNWSYVYNGFGELIEQTDAKGQKSELTYDVRGRLKTRIDRLANGTAETNTTWTYDTAQYGRGQLDNVSDSSSGYIKAPKYDALGRLSKTVTSLGAGGALGNHYEKITYDQFGRTFQVFDAARTTNDYSDNGIQNHYNSHGYLFKVTSAEQINGQPASTYHTINSMDARGNVINEELGNGVTRTALYEHNTGLLSSLGASLGASTFQNLDLQWDQVGNLEQRKETGNSRNLTENFLYDGLNRLKSSQVVGSSAQTLTFNAIGNITHKSDVGSYSYGAGSAGPHAVTSAGGQTYSYDANGNNISGDGRTISYTSFDKPSQIIKGSHKVEFEYGPDRSRYRRTDTNSSNGRVTDTLYIGSVEKITNPDGSKEWKRTIGNVIIKHTFNSGGSQTGKSEHYLLKDHLGSPSLIMDKVAQVQQTLDFDPWGARRTTNWAAMSSTELTNTFFKNHSVSNSVGTSSLTSRGFTGHEMLDEVGIIHMNGRIYDAKLGRFLQADPIIQAPYNTQSLNRYSYTTNNPLNAIDPSGFSFFRKLIGVLTNGIIGELLAAINPRFRALFQIATCMMGNFVACGASAFGNAYAEGASLKDSIKAGFTAGVSSFAFTQAGEFFAGAEAANTAAVAKGTLKAGEVLENGLTAAQTVAKIATHAMIGGVMSELQGGKFGHGFLAAGFTQSLSGKINNIGGDNGFGKFSRVLAASVVGGTASKITGGKFANGAKATAFLLAMRELPAGYKKIVGYDLDMGAGGKAVAKDPLDMPVEGANNIGTQNAKLNPNCMACEGGRVSEALNVVPGVNAVAGVHDVMQVSLGTGPARDILNVPGMVPAAAFTYTAALGQPLTHLNTSQVVGIATTYSRNRERDRDRQLPYVVGY